MACAAPAVLGFLFWQLGPIVASLLIALTDWRIAASPNWIGFDNFAHILTGDRLFRKSLAVTAYYALGSVPLRLLAAFALAVLLNQKIRGLPVFRTIFYLPSIVPLIASSVLWIWLFNPDFGLLNRHPGAARRAAAAVDLRQHHRHPGADPDEHVGHRTDDDHLPRRLAGRAAAILRGGRDRRRQSLAQRCATSPSRWSRPRSCST